MARRPMAKSLLYDGPKDAPLTLVPAHGVAAAMDTPFMETIAKVETAVAFLDRIARR